ncbi:MAG: 50S ribosomal protein L13 [Dehalococcoidia bacterium]|jgi:large subunit ribosomal protein L13|nr:50S ribosomal protein L13 [Dehalococcoidia bacterium]
MRTYSPKLKDIQREWHVIDAAGSTLGVVAERAAVLLRGKHKPMFAPNIDTGDYVIVVNAAKVVLTGNKPKLKTYYRHSGYPGGLRAETFEEIMEKDARRVIEHAVKGMLPKTSLGRTMYRKLRVYAGAEHPHRGQVLQRESSEL